MYVLAPLHVISSLGIGKRLLHIALSFLYSFLENIRAFGQARFPTETDVSYHVYLCVFQPPVSVARLCTGLLVTALHPGWKETDVY